MRRSAVLGISAFYHDSAAALVVDGKVVAAAQEERFTRKKHDADFPRNACAYVLAEAALKISDLDMVVFYDKPLLKFERLIETYYAYAPSGFASFAKAIPVWIKEKLGTKKIIRDELAKLGEGSPKLLFTEHHLSHAASAFYPSSFESAAILTVDGVGEWATTTICHGRGKTIEVVKEINFPHSLGLLYSAFTQYCGFRVNSGEYKLMGLAPYGHKDSSQTKEFRQLILDHLVTVQSDGSFMLRMEYFQYAAGLTMCKDKLWQKLFRIPRRSPESELTQDYMNLALAIQQVTEEMVLGLAETALSLTGERRLCMAGGVALNCVANGVLLRSGLVDELFVQPAAGDAGGALGAALAGCHISLDQDRKLIKPDAMQGSYLGPSYTRSEIESSLIRARSVFTEYPKDQKSKLYQDVAKLIAEGSVVGWFQGRSEFGPRALGKRSILGDPRNETMQKKLNLAIKYREGFRPFAPAVLAEESSKYFDLKSASPYMLLVAPVTEDIRNIEPKGYESFSMYDRLYHKRSNLPSVTHVDYSARVQTVHRETNPEFHALIEAFKEVTGVGVLVNTSFNVRGEPIVLTPEDAFRCFMHTEMDVLVVDDFVLHKSAQDSSGINKEAFVAGFSLD